MAVLESPTAQPDQGITPSLLGRFNGHPQIRGKSELTKRGLMADIGLSTVEYGDPNGPPLVALHGGGDTKHSWAKIASNGLCGRRWICPDLRGHGDSPRVPPWTITQNARDVLSTLDSLGVGQIDVLGHSFGGRVAAEVSRQSPSRVRSAVLIDPPLMTRPEWLGFLERRPNFMDYVTLEWETLDDLVAYLTEGLPPTVRPHAESNATAKVETTDTGRLRMRADAAMFEAIHYELGDVQLSFGGFQGRVLLLVAQRFDAVTEEGHRGLELELGGRLTSVTIDAGHFIWWEQFEEAVTAMEKFLGGDYRGRRPSIDSTAEHGSGLRGLGASQ